MPSKKTCKGACVDGEYCSKRNIRRNGKFIISFHFTSTTTDSYSPILTVLQFPTKMSVKKWKKMERELAKHR